MDLPPDLATDRPGYVPAARVALIAARGVCSPECRHRDCDAARLAREVLERRAEREDES